MIMSLNAFEGLKLFVSMGDIARLRLNITTIKKSFHCYCVAFFTDLCEIRFPKKLS